MDKAKLIKKYTQHRRLNKVFCIVTRQQIVASPSSLAPARGSRNPTGAQVLLYRRSLYIEVVYYQIEVVYL